MLRSLLATSRCPKVGVNKIVRSMSFYTEDPSPSPEDDEYDDLSSSYLGKTGPDIGGVFILQPYVKWGDGKRRNTTPELQLEEATALASSLASWCVIDGVCLPLLSLDRNRLVGKGNLEKLMTIFRSDPRIDTLFVSKNILRPIQVSELGDALGVPVLDRYAVVMRILRERAKTPEARLQVALAELPYVTKKLHLAAEDGRINLAESQRRVLQARETRLRRELEKIREQRKRQRRSRETNEVPSVAIVGYTNAGKTSLVKALTGDTSLEPKDYLFATLDTTAHRGVLPCSLKVVYMDTIGFVQDVPETLVAPFLATFEDTMIADVIVHVWDASHPDRQAQIEHVQKTLEGLVRDGTPVINVANKCDRAEKGSVPDNVVAVSSVNSTGIDLLRAEIERELLAATGRNTVKIRVRSGSPAYAWLYKETAVQAVEPDPQDPQYLMVDVIATPQHLHRFRRFIRE